jgi:hypothetical protein
MNIILLATWPNGQKQQVFNDRGRPVVTSTHYQPFNLHIVPIEGDGQKDLIRFIWGRRSPNPAVPMLVSKELVNGKAVYTKVASPILMNGKAQEPLAQPESPKIDEIVKQEDELVVDDSANDADDLTLADEICKLVADFKSVKVQTMAKNLGVTEEEILAELEKLPMLKINNAFGHKKVEAR